MEYAIGIIGAVSVGLFASWIGFDKERCFYPVVLIVVATYYILFAAMAKSSAALLGEAIPTVVFIAAASLGFKRTGWIVVAGLALHGVFDFFHHAIITDPGVPAWWPGWCLAYDVTAAVYLAVLIRVRRASNAANHRQLAGDNSPSPFGRGHSREGGSVKEVGCQRPP